MRESTALGSALLAGHALGLFGWDLSKPETLSKVNTSDAHVFECEVTEAQRKKMIKGWERAVDRARKWHTVEEEDEDEAEFEQQAGVGRI
jgi:glycerol kinase